MHQPDATTHVPGTYLSDLDAPEYQWLKKGQLYLAFDKEDCDPIDPPFPVFSSRHIVRTEDEVRAFCHAVRFWVIESIAHIPLTFFSAALTDLFIDEINHIKTASAASPQWILDSTPNDPRSASMSAPDWFLRGIEPFVTDPNPSPLFRDLAFLFPRPSQAKDAGRKGALFDMEARAKSLHLPPVYTPYPPPTRLTVLARAAEVGYLPILRSFGTAVTQIFSGQVYPFHYHVFLCAARGGRVDVLDYLHKFRDDWSPPIDQGVALLAAENGHLAVLEKTAALERLTQQLQTSICIDVIFAAARGGSPECMQFVHSRLVPTMDLGGTTWTTLLSGICTHALESGNHKCIEQAVKYNNLSSGWTSRSRDDHPSPPDILGMTATFGDVECLRVVLEHRDRWWITDYSRACAAFASRGKIDCLALLRRTFGPGSSYTWRNWDSRTCTAAAINGHMMCLAYASTNGKCPIHPTTKTQVEVALADVEEEVKALTEANTAIPPELARLHSGLKKCLALVDTLDVEDTADDVENQIGDRHLFADVLTRIAK